MTLSRTLQEQCRTEQLSIMISPDHVGISIVAELFVVRSFGKNDIDMIKSSNDNIIDISGVFPIDFPQ